MSGTHGMWVVGALANVVVSGAYLAISLLIARGLHRDRSWRRNPLAVATAAIFLTCSVGHGLHVVHAVEPWFGLASEEAAAARVHLSDWHVWSWSIATAAAAVWYLTLRTRFSALIRGAAVFEDMRIRERQALEINDRVVQNLTRAKLALELGQEAEARTALEAGLGGSKRIITDLIGASAGGARVRPGDLRRVAPQTDGEG